MFIKLDDYHFIPPSLSCVLCQTDALILYTCHMYQYFTMQPVWNGQKGLKYSEAYEDNSVQG